jgi:hypothetical protein
MLSDDSRHAVLFREMLLWFDVLFPEIRLCRGFPYVTRDGKPIYRRECLDRPDSVSAILSGVNKKFFSRIVRPKLLAEYRPLQLLRRDIPAASTVVLNTRKLVDPMRLGFVSSSVYIVISTSLAVSLEV